jgi:hypothetical protein
MTADVVTFPSKPRQGTQKPVDEDLVRRVNELDRLHRQMPAKSMAHHVRTLINCLKQAKPSDGSKLKPDLKKARDSLVVLAEKFADKGRPDGRIDQLEMILGLTHSIAEIEMVMQEATREIRRKRRAEAAGEPPPMAS